jgi:hypothetical protein
MARKTQRKSRAPRRHRARRTTRKTARRGRSRRGAGKKSQQLAGRLATAMNRLMVCQSELEACRRRGAAPAPLPRLRRGAHTPSLSSQGSSHYEVPVNPYANYARARAAPEPVYARAAGPTPGARAARAAYGTPAGAAPIRQPVGNTTFYTPANRRGQSAI